MVYSLPFPPDIHKCRKMRLHRRRRGPAPFSCSHVPPKTSPGAAGFRYINICGTVRPPSRSHILERRYPPPEGTEAASLLSPPHPTCVQSRTPPPQTALWRPQARTLQLSCGAAIPCTHRSRAPPPHPGRACGYTVPLEQQTRILTRGSSIERISTEKI